MPELCTSRLTTPEGISASALPLEDTETSLSVCLLPRLVIINLEPTGPVDQVFHAYQYCSTVSLWQVAHSNIGVLFFFVTF